MSLAELKREVAGLSPAEQAELVAYINDQLQPDDHAYRRDFSTVMIGTTGCVGMTRKARLRTEGHAVGIHAVAPPAVF